MMTFGVLLAKTKQVVSLGTRNTPKISAVQALISTTLASTSLPVDTLKTLRRSLCSAIASATRLVVTDFSLADYAARRRMARDLIIALGHSPAAFGLKPLAVECDLGE